MTLKEFKAKHCDILLEELTWDELGKLASGAALFYVSLSSKTGAKDNKKILWSGHVLTVGMHWSNTELQFIRLTDNGNAKLDAVTSAAISADGRAALFRALPLPADDPRSQEPCSRWD